MDDGKLNCGKDSAQHLDATNLPLVCPPTASGRFLPFTNARNRPEADVCDSFSTETQAFMQSLLVYDR